MPDVNASRVGQHRGMEQETMDRLLPSVDSKLLRFLRTQVDSFIKWDLLQFFYRNPNTVDTVESIARYIGRSAEATGREMAELSDTGMLATDRVDGMTVYSLSQDPDMMALFQDFAGSCDDQQFRLKAIYHILRNMR